MPVALACAAAPVRSGRLRFALRVCCFALLALLALFAGGFGWFADKVSHMTTPVDPAKADAIIVLTGGQSRLDAAMDLLASGKGERLLISGVHPSASRHQLQVAMGGDKQLFSCCVDIDRAALDTIGNAEESAKWVERHAYGSIILVTNNYHMPRSLLEMGRLLHGARLEPYPVVNTNLGNGSWLTKPEALRVLLTEYSKYLLALARGILPIRPTSERMTLAEASPAKN
ncbi:YdcF family protein [Mesorhizobium sp.]|uniref:YdcF family protein n=1 Tax=Mesorhizobium sp. TaxID=1871066 RepID=UPI0025E13CB6|nr:YdcF family protein [Mesorhizobium sp.]